MKRAVFLQQYYVFCKQYYDCQKFLRPLPEQTRGGGARQNTEEGLPLGADNGDPMESILRIRNEAGSELCHVFRSEKVFRRDFFLVHKHTSLELSLITAGSGRYLTPTGSHEIREGDVFLFCPNEQHCITDADGLSLFNLHFSPRFFMGAEHEAPGFLSVFGGAGALSNRLPHDSDAAIRAAELMRFIRKEAEAERRDRTEMIRAKLTEALILLHREMSEGRSSGGSAAFDKINRAADYIDAHFTMPLSLGEIAAHAHLTRTYFSSLFKVLYGMTPWDYINIKRTEYAKTLLAETDETILTVALRSGFNNTANFNRIFKSVTAMTPSAYRRTKQGEASEPQNKTPIGKGSLS